MRYGKMLPHRGVEGAAPYRCAGSNEPGAIGMRNETQNVGANCHPAPPGCNAKALPGGAGKKRIDRQFVRIVSGDAPLNCNLPHSLSGLSRKIATGFQTGGFLLIRSGHHPMGQNCRIRTFRTRHFPQGDALRQSVHQRKSLLL